jgi:hypothetical protein
VLPGCKYPDPVLPTNGSTWVVPQLRNDKAGVTVLFLPTGSAFAKWYLLPQHVLSP